MPDGWRNQRLVPHDWAPVEVDGGTMWRMRRWVESWGGEVVGEVEAASL